MCPLCGQPNLVFILCIFIVNEVATEMNRIDEAIDFYNKELDNKTMQETEAFKLRKIAEEKLVQDAVSR